MTILRFSAITVLLGLITTSCDTGPYKKAMDLNQLGVEYFHKENDSAYHYFNLAIETDSTFQPAIQNKANFLIKKGQYKEAIKTIDQLIKLKSSYQAWQIKGMLLDKEGNTDEAMKAYKKSVALIKDNQSNTKLTEQQKSIENYQLGFIYLLMNETDNGKNLMIKNLENSKNSKSLHDTLIKYADDGSKLIDQILK